MATKRVIRKKKTEKKKGRKDFSREYTHTYHGSQPADVKAGEGKAGCFFNPLYDYNKVPQTDFDYFLKDASADRLPTSPATVVALKNLADAMVDPLQLDELRDSRIPSGYTYWGQLLDHDITAATDRTPKFDLLRDEVPVLSPEQVLELLKNQRTLRWDLDSLYGDPDGPFGQNAPLYDPQDRVKFRIGTTEDTPVGVVPDDALGRDRDLPRNTGQQFLPDAPETFAVLGDARNDENLIVAQFHLAHLKFHNAVIDALREEEPRFALGGSESDHRDLFQAARKEVTFHFQWLLVNDFLMQLIGPEAVHELLTADSVFGGKPFMPVEFSTAVYRFGHSLVRNAYDFNVNFGRGAIVLGIARFAQLFAFTGKGAIENPLMEKTLPFNWIIQWDRFFFDEATQQFGNRFARKIDVQLADELTHMANEDFDLLTPEAQDEFEQEQISKDQFNAIMKHLARRNLLRGYLFSLPTGQALAQRFNLPILTAEELQQGNPEPLNEALVNGGFLERTPLWYYTLKEADVKGFGSRLGPLGAKVVGGTFIGLLKDDKDSYLNAGWNPQLGIVARSTGQPFLDIRDLLQFGQVMPVSETEALRQID
jgi:Animal haem peroxidase